MVLAWVRCYVVVVLNASILIGDAAASSFPRSPRIPTIETQELSPHSISLSSFWHLTCKRQLPVIALPESLVRLAPGVNQVRPGGGFSPPVCSFLLPPGVSSFFCPSENIPRGSRNDLGGEKQNKRCGKRPRLPNSEEFSGLTPCKSVFRG